ncbi:SdpI family protein [Staphylococcus lugdunensis]|nr:SdpI family protein [Staphylococcus lugdunensis]QEX28792.1 SdpI family protein [Staphylococcus lugdunensis]QEX34077.1 SdpI family protein [Staphylococcus lugdunensis]
MVFISTVCYIKKRSWLIIILLLTVLSNLIITLFLKNSLKNNVGDQVNYFMGLRTKSSMKNKKNWKLTQDFFVKFSIKFSYWFLPLGIVWTIFDIIFGISITSLIIQFILFITFIIVIIIITEKEVKKMVE